MPDAIASKLRTGLSLDDEQFDLLYPAWARALSRLHWTQIEAARRAAQLLVSRPGLRVLDVGAGVGKFSIIGALTTQGQFSGIEQRFHFVRAAREVAAQLGAHSVKFHHGNMTDLDWSSYEGFYLYNPFGENLRWLVDSLDDTIDIDAELYTRYVEVVQSKLAQAAPGTRVVTYHGFGANSMPGFRLEWQEQCLTDKLDLWVKQA